MAKKSIPWNWFKKESSPMPIDIKRQRSELDTHPLARLHEDLDQAFDDIFSGFGWPSQWLSTPTRMFRELPEMIRPSVDVSTDDQEHTVNIEIPGVDIDDVNVEIKNGELIVSGEKKSVCDPSDKNITRQESCYGYFERVLTLPDDVIDDDIQANFKNGVLCLTLPRKALPESDVKKINISRD